MEGSGEGRNWYSVSFWGDGDGDGDGNVLQLDSGNSFAT